MGRFAGRYLPALVVALCSSVAFAQPAPTGAPTVQAPAGQPTPAASHPDHARAQPASVSQSEEPSCARVLARVHALAGEGAWFDLHAVSQGAQALCSSLDAEVSVWNAVALFRLDEVARAKRLLATPEARRSPRADVVSTWIDLEAGNRESYREGRLRLPASAGQRFDVLEAVGDEDRVRKRAARLNSALRSKVLDAHRRYEDAQSKRPWLAATLSALLPGAGQLYDGSLEGAAVAFVINGILIGATTELALEKHYFSATTVGLAASVFYLGNIFNAADLAKRYNRRASEPARLELEALLVPEIVAGP